MNLSPYECPVDLAIGDFNGTRMNPRLSVEEIQGLHDSGLSTDENGETIADVADPEIPFGWSIIEADDPLIINPEIL